MEKTRKTSTIIMGILLGIMLIACISLLPIDLNKTLTEMQENSESAVGSAVGAFVIILFILITHGAFFVFIIACGILLIFLIRNIKFTPVKGIRIANIVELSVDGAIITMSIIKLIILFTYVATHSS